MELLRQTDYREPVGIYAVMQLSRCSNAVMQKIKQLCRMHRLIYHMQQAATCSGDAGILVLGRRYHLFLRFRGFAAPATKFVDAHPSTCGGSLCLRVFMVFSGAE